MRDKSAALGTFWRKIVIKQSLNDDILSRKKNHFSTRLEVAPDGNASKILEDVVRREYMSMTTIRNEPKS